jgi:hypothetical protein
MLESEVPLQLAKYKRLGPFSEAIEESMLSTITTCANLPVFVTGVSGCVISLSTASWQVGESAEGTSRVFHADQAQL